jgi:DNA-binding GntR family transcriptional regulator
MRKPEYWRIANDIRSQIDSGLLAPGDRLPPISALTAQYGATTIAVRNALLMLQTDGLAEGRQGQGTFVTGAPRPAPRSHRASVLPRRFGGTGPRHVP